MSGPYRYFSFPSVEVFDLRQKIPPCDTVIYGGGALVNSLHKHKPNQMVGARRRIAWGVGSTRHGQSTPRELPNGFDLIGSRDIRTGVYTPCASCMSELFNRQVSPKHEIVVYLNNDPRIPKPTDIEGLPLAGNWIPPHENPDIFFAQTIDYLASGNTVLTNSYHGAFWATLLGRKVVVAPAYSSKLLNLKFPPIHSGADGWRASIKKAKAYPEALKHSRMATMAFSERVYKLIVG